MHCKAWVDHKHAHSDTHVLPITQRRHIAINLSSVDTTHILNTHTQLPAGFHLLQLSDPPPPPPLLPRPHFFFSWNRPIKALQQLEPLPYSTCFSFPFPLTCTHTNISTYARTHIASYVHSISLAEPLPPHPSNLCPADRPESQSAWRAVSRVRQNRQRVRRRGGNVGKIGPWRAS